MKYIRIWNDSPLVNRLALEKLGLSSKRNDPSLIGQFGSGIKFAPISCVREGIRWIFAGEDSNGKYLMEYANVKEEDIDSIYYSYLDPENQNIIMQKPSSFTLDAGSLSWQDNFQIYREAISNAIDGANEFEGKWGQDIVSEKDIKVLEDKFCVYITATPGLVEIMNNFDKHFAINRFKYRVSNLYDIIEKIDQPFRVYCKDVLVYSDDTIKSVFDYNLHTVKLNEERKVENLYNVEFQVANVIAAMSDEIAIEEYVDVMFSPDAGEHFEFSKISSTQYEYISIVYDHIWIRIIEENYGENIFPYTSDMSINLHTSIIEAGYQPKLVATPQIIKILKSIGYETDISTILGEEKELDIDYNIDQYPNLIEAREILSQFEPEILNAAIGIYSSKTIAIGITLNVNKDIENRIIVIDKSHAKDRTEDILGTLVHEFDHYYHGIGDGNDESREFRKIADDRMAKLMMKLYRKPIGKQSDNGIEFTIKEISKIGNMSYTTEKSELFNGYILKMGDEKFIIKTDEEIRYTKGLAQPLVDGSSFEVYLGINNFEIKKVD